MEDTEIIEETPEAAPQRRSIAVVRPFVMEAMAIIMSTEETRYYLNGVFIAPHQDGGIVLTATDGHLLVVMRDAHGFAAGPPRIWRHREFAAIIKAKLAQAAKGIRSQAQLRYEHIGAGEGKHDFQVALAFGHAVDDVPHMTWGSSMCEVVGADAAIDGTFPEYSRVIPVIGEKRTGTSISSSLLIRIGKFAEAMTAQKAAPVALELTEEVGPGTFYVRSNGEGLDAVGVVMPMRGTRLHHHPDWLVTHTGRPDLAAPKPLEIDTSSKEDGEDAAVEAAIAEAVRQAA
jgi:hypothetical protein